MTHVQYLNSVLTILPSSGGSLVLDLVNSDFSPKIQIIATTRTPEQAQELIARGVNAITLDLTDSEVTTRAVVENDGNYC